jgi:hypothetical protein
MSAHENFILESLKLEIAALSTEIAKQRQEQSVKSKFDGIPAWLTFEQARALKGAPAVASMRSKPFLQPCRGKRYRLIGGRKCRRKEDAIEWPEVTDESLKEYSGRHGVGLPENYRRRSRPRTKKCANRNWPGRLTARETVPPKTEGGLYGNNDKQPEGRNRKNNPECPYGKDFSRTGKESV